MVHIAITCCLQFDTEKDIDLGAFGCFIYGAIYAKLEFIDIPVPSVLISASLAPIATSMILLNRSICSFALGIAIAVW